MFFWHVGWLYAFFLCYSSWGTPVRSKKTFHQGAFEFARKFTKSGWKVFLWSDVVTHP